MPRALEPGEAFTVHLDCDADKNPRPTFCYRALNGREVRQISATSDRVEEIQQAGGKGSEYLDCLYAAAKIGLLGWRNMLDPQTGAPVPFDPVNIDLVLAPDEVWSLLGKVMAGNIPDADAKKNSASPRSANSDGSANTAPAANAGIALANGNHSASPAQSVTS